MIERHEPTSDTQGYEFRDGNDRTEKCKAFLRAYKQLCDAHKMHLMLSSDLYVETGVMYQHNYFDNIGELETLGPLDAWRRPGVDYPLPVTMATQDGATTVVGEAFEGDTFEIAIKKSNE